MRTVSPPETPRRALPEISLAGAPIHAITERECVEFILEELDSDRGGWVVTPNLDHLRRYSADEAFRDSVNRATLRVPDGRPLLWAANLQGTPLPGLVAGSNLITTLSQAASQRGRSLFLLGGDPGTAEKAASVLTGRFEGLCIAGTHCPDFGFERDSKEMKALAEQLSASGADIIFVALGSPKQEFVIEALREALPNSWWLGVGISFSFVAGDVKRAPRWMQRCGVEWIHRLCQEPRRLARRYLVDGLPFAARFLAGSLFTRFKRS